MDPTSFILGGLVGIIATGALFSLALWRMIRPFYEEARKRRSNPSA